MLELFIDGDGCPVKDETYRVAKRYGLKVFVVANTAIRTPPYDWIEGVVVPGGPDVADDWIAERITAGDIVITADIPLAERCLEKGAAAIGTTGRPFTDKSIGGAMATRELLRDLRSAGAITGGPAPLKSADRSRFLSALDETIQSIRRREAKKRS